MRSKNKSKNELVKAIIDAYQPETAKDVQDALKDIFGPMFEAMLQGEMNSHLGYENNDKGEKQTQNRRNGYISKNVKTSMGEMTIDVPRDRDGSFEPQIVPKRTKDISDIDKKVLSMYAKGMSQRDISNTIEDIYGFKISHDTISPAVYTILGYDIDGHKDILGIWLNETESKHSWMQIFDEIKSRGVEDIFFISMDGVSGLEQGAKEIFKGVVVQRCIVHLIRNSLKYVPSKDYKKFTANLKLIYGAPNLKTAQTEFEKFKNTWSKYSGAVDVWVRNFNHVEQLFDYSSTIRRVMYTTNAIESVNSSFRKVTKKGAFPNENALLKLLYLRVNELYKKWDNSTIYNWAMVRNELDAHPKFQDRFRKYCN